MKKKYTTILGAISIFSGMAGFIVGLITISLEYNIFVSIILMIVSLLVATQASLLFTYPHGKVLQDEKIRQLEWKYKEATRRINNILLEASYRSFLKIVEEVVKESKENKDETVY